jgi:hypothetical protein
MLQRISGEYLEMPGLRLTCAQAQRLFHLDAQACADLFAELVRVRFLARTPDGRYARVSDGATLFPLPRMAKAQLDASAHQRRRSRA